MGSEGEVSGKGAQEAKKEAVPGREQEAKKARKVHDAGTILLMLSLLVAVLYNLYGFYGELEAISTMSEPLGAGHPLTYLVLGATVLFYVCMALLGAYALNALYAFRPNAIRLAQALILLALFENIVLFLFNYQADPGQFSFDFLKGLIWLPYMSFSAGIKERYPPNERTLYARDKAIIVAVLFSIFAYSVAADYFVDAAWSEADAKFVYARCLDAGKQECHARLFDECLTVYGESYSAEEAGSKWSEYVGCLNEKNDFEYCNSQYFSYVLEVGE